MSIRTTPHLNFHGDARAALELYGSAFGGEVVIATYGDTGMPRDAPGAERVVFGQVESADGFRVMAYDIPVQDGGEEGDVQAGSTRRVQGTTVTDRPYFVSVRAQGLEEVQRCWDALSAGGTVIEPLAASAWSPGFGVLADRFGVTWVMDVEAPAPADPGRR